MLNMKKLLTKILIGFAGFVKKTGDTMTGTLIYKSAGKTGASSNWYGRGLELQDKDGLTVGLVTATNRTGQGTGTSFEGVRVINGTNYYNSVRLELDASGNPVTEFGSAATITAWRTALNVPSTAVATTSANGLMSSSDKIAVNKINNTMFKYKTYTYAYSSLAAGKTVNIKASNLGISVPSGYRILGVFYFATGDTAVSVDLVAGSNTGDQTVARLRNHGTAAASGTCTIGITWVKTDFISAL